jgi:[ribosomal protein S5]-alanine N-acetyltransferase
LSKHPVTVEIETKRFLLRDFMESDRAAFLAYQADPRNLTFYNPNESNPDRAARLFELFQTWAGDLPRLNYQLAIIQRQSSHALVGYCGLRTINNTTGEMELGIELAPTYWGGYAYAIKIGIALLDFGFRELKLETISGSTVSANAKIARLAEWVGAEVVARRVRMTKTLVSVDVRHTRSRKYDKTVLCCFSKLTGCIADQHIRLESYY